MRLFSCGHCGNRIYYENVVCECCKSSLGFLSDDYNLTSIKLLDSGFWQAEGSDVLYRKCLNFENYNVCNWMIPANDPNHHCPACRLNQTIPDLSVPGNLDLWQSLETEKRRLVYSLIQLDLPVFPLSTNVSGLGFDFLADSQNPFSERRKVKTGHADGLITINIKEADPVEREKMRGKLDEPYRTLLGHFRHESGHYYWHVLIQNSQWQEEFRQLFGDETMDYGQALERHYQYGSPSNWRENFISSYATMHPWEDWAETWAHYLHVVDTLETAWNFNLGLRPETGDDFTEPIHLNQDPYKAESIESLIERWIPLIIALNSLNRSMGHEYAYPFVISKQVIEKLGFVHRVIHSRRNGNYS